MAVIDDSAERRRWFTLGGEFELVNIGVGYLSIWADLAYRLDRQGD